MNVGDVVIVLDDIDYELTNTATIKLIEDDEDIPGLLWLYLRANDESLNTNIDNRIGSFWRVIEYPSDKIIPAKSLEWED